ncbi:MAG: SMC-Scp complex subunit ScpB [Planctomycetota bacterium]|nr:SMC-Scp complex subunit ScpB [Planctomycetota bacterium]
MTSATKTSTGAEQSEAGESSRTIADGLGAPIEAVLLTADKAIAPDRLAAAVGLAADETTKGGRAPTVSPELLQQLQDAIDALNAQYEETGRVFRIEKVAGGYRLMTLPEYARFIAAFHQQRVQQRLSKAALETLAIIAYRQPVTRAEVEGIRGVACGEVLKTLIDHRLITIQGRAEELGRPILYGTTRQFLDTFGLGSIEDLPPVSKHTPGVQG